MKHNTFLLTVFLSMATLAVYAQPFTQTQAQQVAMQSQQIMQNGQNHDGTIYAPFDNTVPSEQCRPNKAPGKGGGIRKGFDTGAEYGRDDQYPVGEPWILAAFALLFAGVVWLRGKKARAKEAGTKE